MSLQTLIQNRLISCERDATIKEVARLMDEQNIGAILVLEGGKPCGIVTDRDIVVRCVVQDMDCDKRVDDVMTTDVECVNVDDGIYDVIQKMGASKIRRVPVIDKSGQACGLLSFGDVFQLLAKEITALAGPTAPEKPKIVDQKGTRAA